MVLRGYLFLATCTLRGVGVLNSQYRADMQLHELRFKTEVSLVVFQSSGICGDTS